MSRIWILTPPTSRFLWAQQAIETHIAGARVTVIDSGEAWQQVQQRGLLPDVFVVVDRLPWITVEQILLEFRTSHAPVPVLLVSDRPTEGQLARLFDLGLAAHVPLVPPQPLLLAAHVRRVLRDAARSVVVPFSSLFQQIDDSLFTSDDIYTVAHHALSLLAQMSGASWGLSALVDEKQGPIAEVLGIYCPQRMCSELRRGQRYALTDLPLIPRLQQWEVLSVGEMPAGMWRDVLERQRVHWLGVYRFFIGPGLYGLLHLGWHHRAQLSPDALRFASVAAQWFSAIVYRVERLSENRASIQRWKTTTRLMLSLSRSLDADAILRRVLRDMKEVVPYEQASIWERSPSGQLTVRYLEGFPFSRAEFNANIAHFPQPPSRWATFTIVAETRQPLLIPDTARFPAWQELELTSDVRSWLGVPLVYDDRVLGIIALDASRPNAFTLQHLQTAQTLASAAAIALENARLFASEQRRRQQLDALRLVSLQIVSSLETQEVLATLLEQTVALFGAYDAHIFFYDGEQLSFVAAFWDGVLQSRPLSEPRPYGLTYTVVRSGQSYFVPDLQKDPLFRGVSWQGAIAGLPLIAHNKVLGVMTVSWQAPRQFTPEETELLGMAADYAAIALENARLVSDLQHKVRSLSTLSRAGAALRESQSVQEVAENLAREVIALGNGDIAMISRFTDETKTQVVLDYVVGLDEGLIGRFFPLAESGLTAHLLRQNREMLFENLSQSEVIKHREWVTTVGPAIALPLRTRTGDIVGMLLVGRRLGAPRFTEAEIPPLRTLAEMGATALLRAQSQAALEESFLQAILALAQAIDARDPYHGVHSQQLAEWAVAVGREMGLPEAEIENIRLAGLMHDIGKIGIPDEILLKAGPLTPEEWRVMRTHPTIGARILQPLKRLRPVAEIVAAHHERWDGSGYPQGLRGEEIPIGARILAVVDSYGAMIDDRVYRASIGHEAALAEIQGASGVLYDPQVVRAFEAVMEYLGPPPRNSESPDAENV